MSWEESKACTPLKRDFLRAWLIQDMDPADFSAFLDRHRLALVERALPPTSN